MENDVGYARGKRFRQEIWDTMVAATQPVLNYIR